MHDDHKLYQLAGDTFETFSHIDAAGKPCLIPAQNVPMLCWPDGHWCLPANIYLQKLYSRGLSRRDRGGSLLIYAVNLSHLVRFCAKNNVDFIELSDSQFSLFMRSLVGEKDPVTGIPVRTPNTAISIGRVCLAFLATVADLYNEPNFIGPKGRIKAEERQYTLRGRRNDSGQRIFNHWYHSAFPKPSTLKKRLPISTANIARLKSSILAASSSIYLRKRRYVLLRLLEITGARRFEIAALTVESVLQAAAMDRPRLKVFTAKRGDSAYRFIPISRADINFLVEFIDVNRRILVKKIGHGAVDRGPLLISSTTGEKLATNTITQEIALLRRAAQIDGQVCAHMFRHRFITKIFISLVEHHQLSNPDQFRQALIDTEGMKQVVQEWAGHLSRESTDRYINLAFGEAADFSKTCDLVQADSAIGSAKSYLSQIEGDLASGEASAEQIVSRLRDLLRSLETDLEATRSRS